MKIAYTINELVFPKGRIAPKTVIELEDKVFDELEAMCAVRAAEADEIAIAGLSAPAPAPKLTAAEKKAAKKAEEEAAAAAKKAEEDAAAAADPDVVPNPDADLLGDN